MEQLSSYSDIRKNFTSPEMVSKYSQVLGESAEVTHEFLESAIPVIISEISARGPRHIRAMTNRPVGANQDIVFDLFGTDLNSAMISIKEKSGVSSAKIAQGLAMATPSVLGMLATPKTVYKAAPVDYSSKKVDLSDVLFMGTIALLISIMIFSWVDRAHLIRVIGEFI